MDPNTVLAELRALTADVLADKYAVGDEPAYEMAERFEALDEWLKTHGFCPWHDAR